MGQTKSDRTVSMLVGTFVNQDGKVRFRPKGKELLNVRSEWYEGATFSNNVGRQVVVVGMLAPRHEIAIRAIFGLVEPTAGARNGEMPYDHGCDSDVVLCYSWML